MTTRTRKPRKGDRLVYTGPYAPGVTGRYGPGEVVGFRNYGQTVVVRLEGEEPEAWADWPVDQTAPAGEQR